MRDRPWKPPARHWPERPELVAGLDIPAEGTWLGLNDHGLVAAVLNRKGTLGPAHDKRSRGELVLEALDHADAVDAADALSHLSPGSYRAFNMVIADNRDAYWLRSLGHGKIQVSEIPDGLSMITAGELDDPADPRIAHWLPRFAAAPKPDPESGDWSGWQALLGSGIPPGATDPEAALCFLRDSGFGTSSSALIGLPAIGRQDVPPVWLFAAGPPDKTEFLPVAL